MCVWFFLSQGSNFIYCHSTCFYRFSTCFQQDLHLVHFSTFADSFFHFFTNHIVLGIS